VLKLQLLSLVKVSVLAIPTRPEIVENNTKVIKKGNTTVFGIRNCYHGLGGSSESLTSYHNWTHNTALTSLGARHTMCPDPLHGPFGGVSASLRSN